MASTHVELQGDRPFDAGFIHPTYYQIPKLVHARAGELFGKRAKGIFEAVPATRAGQLKGVVRIITQFEPYTFDESLNLHTENSKTKIDNILARSKTLAQKASGVGQSLEATLQPGGILFDRYTDLQQRNDPIHQTLESMRRHDEFYRLSDEQMTRLTFDSLALIRK